jgi:electron transfer flavoprotein alpha subunit
MAVDCMDVRLVDGNLEIDRMMYGGNAVVTQGFSAKPAIATVAPRTFDPLEPDEGRTGDISDLNVEMPAARANVTGETQKTSESVDLGAATVIVSCGRGIKNKEDIAIIEKLAKALDAEVGCSRPIASDLKWLSVDHWVGLSGKKVKPQMYLAVGISGQIQHLAGMRDSKIIVAINKDADAPIFKAADYGIVGDLYKIVDELVAKLQ